MKKVTLESVSLVNSTSKITGCFSIKELLEQEKNLFTNESVEELTAKLKSLYKDKDFAYPTERKEIKDLLLNSLIVRLKISQKREKELTDNGSLIGVFMSSRLDISKLSSGLKRPQIDKGINFDFGTLKSMISDGLDLENSDFTEFCTTKGINGVKYFPFIERLTTIDGEIKNGNVTLSAKRKSSTSGVLTLNGSVLFQKSNLVMKKVFSVQEVEEANDFYVNQELQNEIDYKHNGEVDFIQEERTETLAFTPVYQSTINELYSELNLKNQVSFSK